MADVIPRRPHYQFGPFVVDPRKRLLWKAGALVPLTSKPFAILVKLLDNRGRVVEKDELFEAIWSDTSVSESTLARHISTLRKVLEERPDEHSYIVTVPGSGYEFVADVLELEQPPDGLGRNVDANGTHEMPDDEGTFGR